MQLLKAACASRLLEALASLMQYFSATRPALSYGNVYL